MEQKSKFRLQAKGWFLTYPRCNFTKEDILTFLKAKREGLKQILVARELHADGSPHIHAYLYYESKFNCTNERFFDLGSCHPNIQVAKSLKAVQAYVKKDGDYIQEGMDYKSELESIRDHRAVLGKRFLDGENPVDIISENPALFFDLPKITQALNIWKGLKTPPLPRCTDIIPNTWGLHLNVSSSKDRHYWFWSESPNKGKTTFLQSIQSKFPSLWYSWTEKYQSPSPSAQFVLLDEYSIAHLTVMTLNQICDGTYQYPVKGCAPFALPNSIVLVCGNKDPLEVYTDAKNHALIKARFTIIDLDVPPNPLDLKYYDPMAVSFCPINGPNS